MKCLKPEPLLTAEEVEELNQPRSKQDLENFKPNMSEAELRKAIKKEIKKSEKKKSKPKYEVIE